MDGPLRMGIVGTGTMARQHAAVFADQHRAEVVAWASRATQASELAAFGPARVHRDPLDLVADPDVDAVLVATPDFLHRDVALAAIAAGKPVLIEKPLATNLADARAIRDAARESGVTAMTLFNHRWVPAYWQAKERIDMGLGAPVLAYARKNDTIFVPTSMIGWAAKTTPSWFLSSHDIDLVLWYFGQPAVEVYATAVRGVLTGMGIDTPDAVQAQVRFEGGAVATFEACWIYPNTFPTMTDSFIELIFAAGVIHLDRKVEQLEIATPQAFEYPRNQLLGRAGGRPSGSVAGALRHFIDVVLDGGEPLVTMDSSVAVTAILEAIARSCESGGPVSVES